MPNFPSTSPPAEKPDLIVRGQRIVTPEGERAAAIHIRGGVITAISSFEEVPLGVPIHEAADSVVFPGLVDTHVHINEPGRTDWEGSSTASAYREKVAAAAGKLSVDVGFWGGVVPGNTDQLAPLWEAGVFGFKCFLVPSGVGEFPHVA